jgi:hypothetical protein
MPKRKLNSYRMWNVRNLFFFIILFIPFLKFNFKISNYIDLLYVFYFLYILTTKSNIKDPIIGALILLVITPFLVIMKREIFANIIMVSVFYLLSIGIVTQLVHHIKTKKSNGQYKK